jgi:hypothetical protein
MLKLVAAWVPASVIVLSGCDEINPHQPIVVQLQPAPPVPAAASHRLSAYDSSVGKAACIVFQLTQAAPTGHVCGVLSEVKDDGLVLTNVEKKNDLNIEAGLSVVFPESVVRYVVVRP